MTCLRSTRHWGPHQIVSQSWKRHCTYWQKCCYSLFSCARMIVHWIDRICWWIHVVANTQWNLLRLNLCVTLSISTMACWQLELLTNCESWYIFIFAYIHSPPLPLPISHCFLHQHPCVKIVEKMSFILVACIKYLCDGFVMECPASITRAMIPFWWTGLERFPNWLVTHRWYNIHAPILSADG